jgi:hypothetical protein
MALTIRTHLCKLLEIEAPIFAAPMGFLTGPHLAAAVMVSPSSVQETGSGTGGRRRTIWRRLLAACLHLPTGRG